jgi:hypothetical protein
VCWCSAICCAFVGVPQYDSTTFECYKNIAREETEIAEYMRDKDATQRKCSDSERG